MAQTIETTTHRKWNLEIVAVMTTHFHAIVDAPEDVPGSKILGDMKSYASRSLNSRWPKPTSGTWWTESGSHRRLPNVSARENASSYVLYQEYPLVTWTRTSGWIVGSAKSE
ncbi:MAG: transposase [Pirellulales bacterium]